jgi:hypothetical protein
LFCSVCSAVKEKKRASAGELVSWLRSNGGAGCGITQVDGILLNLMRQGRIRLGKPGVDEVERYEAVKEGGA